jgi:hypothetical protein
VLYITSSSYSGSTLLAFLLNTHPDIFTVSEMNGWHYGADKTFHCSCGQTLETCPLFTRISETFRAQGLPFDPRDFGTEYMLAGNERINRYLTGGLPAAITSTPLEVVRDVVIGRIPAFRRRLAAIDRINRLFIETALEWSGARTFVDACKDVFRLRHLRRIANVRVVYLVRDIRGVVLSNLEMNRSGWTARLAAKRWLQEQTTISRVLREFPRRMAVRYEDLCASPQEILASIHRFAALPPRAVPEDFKTVEHHILGNAMRLSAVSRIVNSERWKQDLPPAQRATIEQIGNAFVTRRPGHPVSELLRRYFSESTA